MSYDVSFLTLQTIARKVGIDVIGVTGVEPFEELLPLLKRFYEEGRASGFEHPDAAVRIDPLSLLPNASSMISIAVAYVHEDAYATTYPKKVTGLVSKYAWGTDYHRIVTQKLERLAYYLQKQVHHDIAYKIAVDTSALVDRAVAERAGIGFIGKNCSLITDEFGSWVFLGTLLVDIEIERTPEAQMEHVASLSCQDCDLCLTACPTDALIAPFVIDSTRCLSYITQSKGMIPEEFRAPLGRRVWGCDTCQTVCPLSKTPSLTKEPAFFPERELAFPDLYYILSLTNRTFQQKFGHTAVAWRGLAVWRRNAIIALGNIRDDRAVPLLIDLLADARPEIRASAAWALRQIDAKEGTLAVAKAFHEEKNPQVLIEMRYALALTESNQEADR